MKPADLQALVAAMSKRPYRYNEITGDIEAPNAGPNRFLPKPICQLYVSNLQGNQAGLCALANHADALVDLYAATRAYFESDDEDRVAEMDAMQAALARLGAIR